MGFHTFKLSCKYQSTANWLLAIVTGTLVATFYSLRSQTPRFDAPQDANSLADHETLYVISQTPVIGIRYIGSSEPIQACVSIKPIPTGTALIGKKNLQS